MKYCTHCGAPMEDAQELCPACGAATTSQAAGAPAVPQEPAAPAPAAEATAASAPTQPQTPPQPMPYNGQVPPGTAPGMSDSFGGPAPAAPQPPVPPVPPVQPQSAPAPGGAPQTVRDAAYSTLIDSLGSNFFMVILILMSGTAVSAFLQSATATDGNVLSALLSQVFSILYCVALWMSFASARSVQKGAGTFSTYGLRMYRMSYKVCCILVWVVLGICSIAMLIGGGALFAVLGSYGDYYMDEFYDYGYGFGGYDMDAAMAGYVSALVIGIFVVMIAAVLVLTILGYIKTMRTLKAVLETANTGVPTRFVSMYVIVINFITGGFSVLSALGGLGAGQLFMVLTGGCTAAYTIMIGVGMLRYKKKMEALAYSAAPSAPVYPTSGM